MLRELNFGGSGIKTSDVTIVIPVFNQLNYTRGCLESLNASGCADPMIIVINNASTDGTKEFLAQRRKLRVIENSENLACAAPWNQGLRLSKTDWILFLNNDVVVTDGWLENLLSFAEKKSADIVSPAMGEGVLDYDLASYANEFTAKMKNVHRADEANGACFLVRRRVFDAVGTFDEHFRKGGNEDQDFFCRAQQADFKLMITGSCYVHHFGSVTQKALNTKRHPARREEINYFRKKWDLGWLKRRWLRFQRKSTNARWVGAEHNLHGHSLREVRLPDKIRFF